MKQRTWFITPGRWGERARRFGDQRPAQPSGAWRIRTDERGVRRRLRA